MRLRWTPSAASDLESIHMYLFSTDRPATWTPGIVPGTRALVLPRLPYILVYRVTSEIVEISGSFAVLRPQSQ